MKRESACRAIHAGVTSAPGDREDVRVEREYLQRHWPADELGMLEANAPSREEVDHVRSHSTWWREHREALQETLGATKRLRKVMHDAEWPSPDGLCL